MDKREYHERITKLQEQNEAFALRCETLHEKRKTAHWVFVGRVLKMTQYDCSECGAPQTFIDVPPYYRYCPMCGARMNGSAEDGNDQHR